MKTNWQILKVCINQLDQEIDYKNQKIRAYFLNEDYQNAIKTYESQLKIHQEIEKLISHFKLKLNDNYLEKRLFSKELETLEQSIIIPNFINEILHCAQILFVRLKNIQQHKKRCINHPKTKLQQVTTQEKRLVEQIEKLLSTRYVANISAELTPNQEQQFVYDNMIHQLMNYYEQQKTGIKKQLTLQTYLLHLSRALQMKTTIDEANRKIELLKLL